MIKEAVMSNFQQVMTMSPTITAVSNRIPSYHTRIPSCIIELSGQISERGQSKEATHCVVTTYTCLHRSLRIAF